MATLTSHLSGYLKRLRQPQQRLEIPWSVFRSRFEQATFPHRRAGTVKVYTQTFNAFEEHCKPQFSDDLTTASIAAFSVALRQPRIYKRKGERYAKQYTPSEATVARHLRNIKAIARWGAQNGCLVGTPRVKMPPKAAIHPKRGEPLTPEEFDRLLKAAPRHMGAQAGESWQVLLQGLWTTGLRLSDAMALRWDPQPDSVVVSLESGEYLFNTDAPRPRDRDFVPMAPEAVQLLKRRKQESGYVFLPLQRDGSPMLRDVRSVSKVVSAIGRASGVLVGPKRNRTATAHDLRRAFACRWAEQCTPTELMRMMRLSAMESAAAYYPRNR